MRRLLLVALLAGCWCPPRAPDCACDCPEGPPPQGRIDTYCLDAANDGKACCFGDGAGICKDLECQ